MPEAMTTVKVRKATRDRINAEARQRRMSADQYIEYLLDEAMWAARLEQARSDMSSPDASYVEETRAWDVLQADIRD